MTKQKLIVTKSNMLNEMHSHNMTLQELRMLTIYIAKINPLDVKTATVQFTLGEFHAIMDTPSMRSVRTKYYIDVADKLIKKVIKIPYKDGFKAFSLFKYVIYARDDVDSPYYFEITAHDDALPLLFELRSRYFKYELWNALRLNGKNQLRMYEILKQYEYLGYRVIKVDELKAQLGIDEADYPQFKHFKQNVLEPCKKALEKNTDITFEFEPHKKGAKGKILELRFNITKNKNFVNQLSLSDFIDLKTITTDAQPINLNDIDPDETEELLEQGKITKREDFIIFLRGAMDNEFTVKQVSLLYDIALNNLPSDITSTKGMGEIRCYDYFQSKYRYMLEKAESGEIKNRYGYMKKIIAALD